jgi:hypothetical protein
VTEASRTTRVSEILASLLEEREALRRHPGGQAALEANRLGIAYWRSRLASLEAEQGELADAGPSRAPAAAGEVRRTQTLAQARGTPRSFARPRGE